MHCSIGCQDRGGKKGRRADSPSYSFAATGRPSIRNGREHRNRGRQVPPDDEGEGGVLFTQRHVPRMLGTEIRKLTSDRRGRKGLARERPPVNSRTLNVDQRRFGIRDLHLSEEASSAGKTRGKAVTRETEIILPQWPKIPKRERRVEFPPQKNDL